MTNFVCRKCGYKFESVSGKKCPYCEGENVEREKSAEELVDNAKIE